MKCNYIHIKLKDQNNLTLNYNKILEIFKLSFGNDIIDLNYNQNKNLDIIYYKKYIKKNIGKMIYKNTENNKEIKIFSEIFVLNNIKIAKIIINNKQNELKEKIGNEKQLFKIKIKFLNNIVYLNSMFEDCQTLLSVNNFLNLNTKYLKAISRLFYGCSSLLYINDLYNWDTSKIEGIEEMFSRCSNLKSIPDISKWKTYNINNMYNLFSYCSSLKELPDISKWDTNNVIYMTGLFAKCSSLVSLPDISKWNISNVISIR